VGAAVVYTSESYAGALLEVLAWAGIGRLPRGLVASRIVLPTGAEMESAGPAAGSLEKRSGAAREIGQGWLARRSALGLRVPSAVARPWGWNVVLNPAHQGFARVEVMEQIDVVWDARLR